MCLQYNESGAFNIKVEHRQDSPVFSILTNITYTLICLFEEITLINKYYSLKCLDTEFPFLCLLFVAKELVKW